MHPLSVDYGEQQRERSQQRAHHAEIEGCESGECVCEKSEDCDEKGVTTVSGLITKRLGSFPKVGDVLELGRYELRVEQTFRLQVEQARLTQLSDREPSEEAPAEED